MSTEINPVVNIEEVEEQKTPSAPNRLKRVKLIVAYDGTNYHGWQVQPNGETIEGVLNRTLSSLLGEKIVVTGASRTDAGVDFLCPEPAAARRYRSTEIRGSTS